MSKRKWHHPEVPAGERTTKAWRSAGELEDTSGLRQWVEREFPRAAETMRDEDDRESTRRDFLKVMGASTALAGFGLAACRRPIELIVPYIQAPEWVIPGKPLYYTSAMPVAGGSVPLMVTNFEGRPTKLEPNKIHPSGVGTDAFAQASVLNLYDPARSRYFLSKGKKLDWADGLKALGELTKSKKVAFVFGEDDSPTRGRLRGELAKKFGGAKFYGYEALSGLGRKQSSEAIFGKGVNVVADFDQAKCILSVDSDFLELDRQGPVKGFYDSRHINGRDYTKDAVKNAKNMNRLYVAEAAYSLTGGLADHRAPVAPSQVGRFLAQLAMELGVSIDLIPGGKFGGTKNKWITECRKDLEKNRGKSLVLLGSRYSKELHDLAFLINQKLGAYGKTLKAFQTGNSDLGNVNDLVGDLESGSIETVIFMGPSNPVYENPTISVSEGKKVSLGSALKKVKMIHWGTRIDATANAADLHIPAAHYLESWGDTRTATGIYSVVQPMILPLYGGVTELEVLSSLLGDKIELRNTMLDTVSVSTGYDAVRATFKGLSGTSGRASEAAWMKLLREGFLTDSAYDDVTSRAKAVTVPVLAELSEPSGKGLDIIFQADSSVWDGRYIDNAWLQEAPDPISKVCWDNALHMSPATAKDLGIYEELVELEKKSKAWWSFGTSIGPDIARTDRPEEGEGASLFAPVANVTVKGKSLEAPVIVSFGMADNVVAISLGYGQAYDEHWGDQFKDGTPEFYDGQAINIGNTSSVGVNTGFNGYPLRADTDYFTTGAVVTRSESGSKYKMARTQEHHSMYGRAIAREVSTQKIDDGHGHVTTFADQLKKVQKQGVDSHAPENISLYKPENRDGEKHLSDKSHQWAMSIDLSVCNGCNACLVACQAENNIPVVGKTQVAMGREMHWIRMDRYYAAPEVDAATSEKEKEVNQDSWIDTPEMIPQPVACVQCESAPCETVCPVNATVHTEDGLNSMAYNRCIGTRYCANNCPYKARRFNFFDYNKRDALIHKNLYKGPLGKKSEGDSKHLQRNPNVSVRMRGVMEKCTYCVQRLQEAKIEAKQITKKKALAATSSVATNVTPKDLMSATDKVKVACQDSCEAGAVVFGNLLDPNSTIRRIKDNNNKLVLERGYDLLNYIGTLPRTSYLARVKNPNPAMPGSKLIGKATINMH